MRLVHNLDEEAWRAFVTGHPAGNIFHSPEMTRVFAQAQGYDPAIWAVLGAEDEILALFLPVQITILDNLFLRRLTTRAVAYGSVLSAPTAAGQQALDLLLRAYNREMKSRLLFTELRNLEDLSDVQPVLAANGLAYEDHLNFLIDLTRPTDEIWGAVRSNAQRNIRKAQKAGVDIVEVEDLPALAEAYAVLQQVYRRIQVPLPDESLFRAAFEHLRPRGMFRVLLACVEGRGIGALTLLLYKGVMTYWYTGTLREFWSFRAGDLLVWTALELGQAHGMHTFDFGGGGKPDEEYGVRDFKAKFGGNLVNYGRNICVHAPLRLNVSQMGFQLLRRFL